MHLFFLFWCEISKTLKTPVEILHIAKDKSGESGAAEQLNKQIAKFKENTGVSATPIIQFGNIFDVIPKVTEELTGELVVMGTHGMRGMQFITGSNALRVITDSDAQFIVVQENTTRTANIKKILVPLDLHKETKQKLAIVANLADYFHSRVHVITPDETAALQGRGTGR